MLGAGSRKLLKVKMVGPKTLDRLNKYLRETYGVEIL